jgi:uncharacterized repeat protein (TIGR03803 family)
MTERVVLSTDQQVCRIAYAGVIRDANGNLYGTTAGGGAYGLGVVWKLIP